MTAESKQMTQLRRARNILATELGLSQPKTNQMTPEEHIAYKQELRRTKRQLRKEIKRRLFEPQELTDPRFMSRTQREAWKQGVKIYV